MSLGKRLVQEGSRYTASFACAVVLSGAGLLPPRDSELFEKWISYSFNAIILNRTFSETSYDVQGSCYLIYVKGKHD